MRLVFSLAAISIAFAGSCCAAWAQDARRAAQVGLPATVVVVARDPSGTVVGQGSGFFISADGDVITNIHVVEDAEDAIVLANDGSMISVTGVVAAGDGRVDLIRLKTGFEEVATRTYLRPLRRPLEVGEPVVAIGAPHGHAQTVSPGIVSAIREVPGLGTVVQFTAPVSAGSSGGPLVTLDGELVGVVVALFPGAQNLNYAIPAREIESLRELGWPFSESLAAWSDQRRTLLNRFGSTLRATADSVRGQNGCPEAIPLYEAVIDSVPDLLYVRGELGLCYLQTGRTVEAANMLRAAFLEEMGNYQHANGTQPNIKTIPEVRRAEDFEDVRSPSQRQLLARLSEGTFKLVIRLRGYLSGIGDTAQTLKNAGRLELALQVYEACTEIARYYAVVELCGELF